MGNILKISVDPKNLNATLSLDTKNDPVINELKLICSGLSDNYTYYNLNFSIPWFELRRGLSGIAWIKKKYDLHVHYNEFTKQLIEEIVADKRNIKEKKSAIEFEESELQKLLQKEGFKRVLKDEQKRDTIALLKLKHGANFSVPGAGKTTTILAVHTILKHFGIVNKLFVVSPINAFISWQDEIVEIFANDNLKVLRLQKTQIESVSSIDALNPDVILVNYEKLRSNVNQLAPYFFKNNVHLVLDESHRVKSGLNNISYSQIIKLADFAKRRDILSGTPMPQSYIDLDPQFDFLWPGEKVIPDNLNTKEPEEAAIHVNQSIEGLFVRTTKNELGLDDPIIKYTNIPMGKIQAELYRLFKSETARTISGMDKPTVYNFRKIGRSVVKLLQASTNPMLLSSKDEYGEEIFPVPLNKDFWELLEDFQKYEKPVKIEYLKKRVKELTAENRSNKILIWTYFVRNILLLERLFTEYNPVSIYGGVPTGSDEDEANREGRIRKFHEDDTCRVMIANPQACGEGISLHKVCHHAIYLDRNFNAAFFLQSIDRIHRLGLQKGIDTNIEILICENSIDEILINRLNDKIIAMGSVLEDPYLHSLAYDPVDFSPDEENAIDLKDFDAIKEHVTNR